MFRPTLAPQITGPRQLTATVGLDQRGSEWGMKRQSGAKPFVSSDPDTRRIWWTDVGVHQNLTFPVHPDPISGQHCWHQAVRVQCARPGDEAGDIAVDTAKSHRIYQEWLKKTRPASIHSPDRMRRPYWLLRPLKPAKEVYRIPAPVEPASTSRE